MPEQPKDNNATNVRSRVVSAFLWALVGITLAGYALVAMLPGWAVAVLWSMGFTSVGLLLGFLFGLPRVQESAAQPLVPEPSPDAPAEAPDGSARPPDPGARRLRLPDGLLEVADWLTKIIVGLGLVNLTKVPEQLDRLAIVVAARAGNPVGYGLAPGASLDAGAPSSAKTAVDALREQLRQLGQGPITDDQAIKGLVEQISQTSRLVPGSVILSGPERQRLLAQLWQMVERVGAEIPAQRESLSGSVARFTQATMGAPDLEAIARQLAPHVDHSAEVAMIIFFPTVGLLLGYLLTRLWIQAAMLYGDRDAISAATGPPFPPAGTDLKANQEAARDAANDRLESGESLPDDSDRPSAMVAKDLAELQNQYAHVRIPDYRARVLRKNEIASQMYDATLRNKVGREWLASQNGDGYIHVLATWVLARPNREDAFRLVKAAQSALQKHTKYRVCEAMRALIKAGVFPVELKHDVRELLDSFAREADDSLTKQVRMTREALDGIDGARETTIELSDSGPSAGG